LSIFGAGAKEHAERPNRGKWEKKNSIGGRKNYKTNSLKTGLRATVEDAEVAYPEGRKRLTMQRTGDKKRETYQKRMRADEEIDQAFLRLMAIMLQRGSKVGGSKGLRMAP